MIPHVFWCYMKNMCTVRVDTKKPPVLDKGTLGFLWFAQNRIGNRQEETGKGGHALSVFLEKQINVPFSYEYDLDHDHDLDHDLDHDKQQSFSYKNTQIHQFCNKYALFDF